jgi:hypothetical protein
MIARMITSHRRPSVYQPLVWHNNSKDMGGEPPRMTEIKSRNRVFC